jgi:hypothetical protein
MFPQYSSTKGAWKKPNEGSTSLNAHNATLITKKKGIFSF